MKPTIPCWGPMPVTVPPSDPLTAPATAPPTPKPPGVAGTHQTARNRVRRTSHSANPTEPPKNASPTAELRP